MSKTSKSRPFSVSSQVYDDNYHKIFPKPFDKELQEIIELIVEDFTEETQQLDLFND